RSRVRHHLPRRFLIFNSLGRPQFFPRQPPDRFPIVRLHMIQRDYLIIGSGIGGSSACESIRKYDKRGQVTLVGAETFPPYKRWMLSKSFLRDKVPPMKKMPVLDAHWYEKHKIETRF